MKTLLQLFIDFRKYSQCPPEILYIHTSDFQDFKQQLDKVGFNAIPDVHVSVSPYCVTGYYG